MIYSYDFQTEQRLDRFCRKYYKDKPEITLSQIFFWIRKGKILVNGKTKKQEYRIQYKDEITLAEADVESQNAKKIKPKHIHLKPGFIEQVKIWEDDDYLVFDKPSDYIIHPNSSNNGPNMQYVLDMISGKDNLTNSNPSFCFRLDKGTSGILIAGKNYDAVENLNEQIRNRTVSKTYLAIAVGKFEGNKTLEYRLEKVIDKKFGRGKMIVSSAGVDSKTEVKAIKNLKNDILGDITLLEIKLYTGRMHQIRVHLAHIGYPVLGDIIYGNPSVNRKLFVKIGIKRHFLHCRKYSFHDKKGKIINLETKIPEEFEKIGKIEKNT